jgi:cytochrome c
MSMLKPFVLFASLLLTFSTNAQPSGFGEEATQQDIDRVFFAVFPDGQYLPPGEGTATQGKALYEIWCVMCHGEKGAGDPADVLAGGQGSLTLTKPELKKTIGSYWPYATSLFDYLRRAMPLIAPMSLSNDEYYALTAYLLQINDLINEETAVNQDSILTISMPNRDGFINALDENTEKNLYPPAGHKP